MSNFDVLEVMGYKVSLKNITNPILRRVIIRRLGIDDYKKYNNYFDNYNENYSDHYVDNHQDYSEGY